MSMLLKHRFLICNNGIFSTGNLIIVVYNQYILFFTTHTYYLYFSIIFLDYLQGPWVPRNMLFYNFSRTPSNNRIRIICFSCQ